MKNNPATTLREELRLWGWDNDMNEIRIVISESVMFIAYMRESSMSELLSDGIEVFFHVDPHDNDGWGGYQQASSIPVIVDTAMLLDVPITFIDEREGNALYHFAN
jgi:hypothetical protein